MIVIKDKKQALNLLLQGKVLVLPSETSYGISCVANNQKAVDKIFAIKKRDKNKSLLIVVPTIMMAKKYLLWNKLLRELAKNYWPGILTIISEIKKNDLAKGVVSDKKTLALRVTNQPILKYLSSKLSYPLVSTSANISGQEAIYDVNAIVELFEKRKIKPDAILDCGRLPKNKASTIVSVVGDELIVVRQGGLINCK